MTEEHHYENYRANYLQSTENNNNTDSTTPKLATESVEQRLNEKDEEVMQLQNV